MSPSTRANNIWEVNGGDDVLQVIGPGGSVLAGIGSSGAGFGALAGSIGGVTSVTGVLPITSTGGNTPVIGCPTCATAAVNISANALVKADGAKGLTVSSITDNGTIVATTEPIVISANGAVSQSAISGTGSIFTGGSGTTTFPYLYLNHIGAAAVTSFNTAGTPFAINTPGGFTGDTLAFFANSSRILTVNSGGQITSNGNIVAGINSAFSISSRSAIRSNSDGSIEFSNNAGTGFTLFQLGGTTNSFPGLLVNGNSLQVQLADSSGQTGFSAKTYSTETACYNSASPAVCGSASFGSVAIPAGTASTLTINTTAVTAKSQILLTVDPSVAISGTTCNTNYQTQPAVISRVVGTSITIQAPGTSSGNPVCVSYTVFN